VIAGALAGGAPDPSWVAVDDGSGSWVVEASTRPSAERARGVVAVSSEDSLVKAQLLGVGGALWLPPSSLGALEAFSTALSAEAPVALDAAALELLDGRTPIQVVSIVDRRFWRSQVGDRVLENLITELAIALEAPAAILRWPALVVADRDPGQIVTAWEELASKRGTIGPSVNVLSLEPKALEGGLLDGAYAALAGSSSTTESPGQVPPQPIHELPHGRRVGWWLIRNDQKPEEEGWVATPVEAGAARCRWQVEGGPRKRRGRGRRGGRGRSRSGMGFAPCAVGEPRRTAGHSNRRGRLAPRPAAVDPERRPGGAAARSHPAGCHLGRRPCGAELRNARSAERRRRDSL